MVFSKSSPEPLGRQLIRSLWLIRDADPEAYGELTALASGLRVGLEVDGEELTVDFGSGPPKVRNGIDPASDVFVETSRQSIGDVIDGRRSLIDLIEHDSLRVRGPIDALIAVHDALQVYAGAVMKTPRHPRYPVA